MRTFVSLLGWLCVAWCVCVRMWKGLLVSIHKKRKEKYR